MQWKSVAVDGGSAGRGRPAQETETVRGESSQTREIKAGVAKIFDFFTFSNLFLANQTSQRQFHLLQDKIDESSKGHFLCCEIKLVTSSVREKNVNKGGL